MLLAHITGLQEQTLLAHTRAVAEGTANRMMRMGLYHTGYLAGLLHDMGKASRAFQEYLRRAANGERVVRGSVPHSGAGMLWLAEQFKDSQDGYLRAVCELVGYAVGAHHGLMDCVTPLEENNLESHFRENRASSYYAECKTSFFLECVRENELREFLDRAKGELLTHIEKLKEKGGKQKQQWIGFSARLLLSALMDADRRDTVAPPTGCVD